MLYALIFFILLAILGPLFGRDSRDGRDWAGDLHYEPRRHVQGDKHSPEPEECSHELQSADDSPAYRGRVGCAGATG
ncbi:hypothetical protein [Actinocorallia aurantiaca]|uniref:Secreted protein n=1 Tax=Actinocorallia aurantiaca TaxID=46204 RepID=A0ABP6GUM5_9ACTN